MSLTDDQDQDRSSLFILADRAYGGEMLVMFRRWRDANVALRAIQNLVEQDLGVRIALETIRRWVALAEQERAA